MLVQGLDQRAQGRVQTNPSSKAGNGKANATGKTHIAHIKSIGGCIAKPGSCNNGFKSRPSKGAGNRRSND